MSSPWGPDVPPYSWCYMSAMHTEPSQEPSKIRAHEEPSVNATLVGPGGERTHLPLLSPGLGDHSTQQGQSLPWGDAVQGTGKAGGPKELGVPRVVPKFSVEPIHPPLFPGQRQALVAAARPPRAWHVATSLPGSSS